MTLFNSEQAGDDELQLVGRLIGETFRLRACIASGSSGSVYRADQIALGRTVAVKILRPELALDPRFISNFHHEALAASRLNHPNTVAVIDYGQTEDGLLYLAMEYLRGLSLADVARAERPLDLKRIVDFVTQIAAGIEEAHEAGVVHADLKPDNVVVEHKRRDWDLVKVVDFGIARLLGAPRDEGQEHVICGTPEYMAPEVVRGEEPVVASDIYALGAILFELIAGRPPFVGTTSVEILSAHLKDPPPPLSELPDCVEVPDEVEEVARRALAKNQDDRFPSASAFRDALQEVAGASRVPGVAPVEAAPVRCAACGAKSAAHFKFCPECGQPRRAASDAEGAGHEAPTSAAPAASPADAPSLLPLPLRGRKEALARVRALLGADGGALHITGPAGSGKTRLVHEALASSSSVAPDLAAYVAGPDPSGLALPYYPIRAAVAAGLGLPARCTYDELERAAFDLGLGDRDLPGITELLAPRGELDELEARSRQRELFASARRVLTAVCTSRAAVFVFEDADRYDDPSLRLVADLAERARAEALRVVVTTTRGEGRAGGALLRDARGRGEELATIDLNALREEDVAAIARHASGHGAAELPALSELYSASAGNPGHLNEIVRLCAEGGAPPRAQESAADVVAARVELLPRAALLVAQALAAHGAEASEADIGAALGDALDQRELRDAAALLEARGVIAAGQLVWFERAIFRDIVYDRTPAEARRALHAAYAAGGSGLQPGSKARHYEGAGYFGAAAEGFELIGDEAAKELHDIGAARHYQRAVANARRAMLAEVEDDLRELFIRISVKLAAALARTAQPVLARGVLDEALGHCHEAPALKAEILQQIGHVHAATGEFAAASASLRQAIGLGIMAGDRELLARLYLDLASYQAEAGKQSQAIFELTEGMDLITAGEGGGGGAAPPSLWRLALRLGKLHADRGERERALAMGQEAEKLAQRGGSGLGEARAQAMIAAQHEALGDGERAAKYRRSAADRMRALGDRRGTVDLLLSGSRLTRHLRGAQVTSFEEAEELADEIGWDEGARRARTARERSS